MTNKELEKKIEELSAQIEALKGELKEKPKGEIWKPKEGEKYWYVDLNEIEYATRGASEEELADGNYYPTREKAEYEANREKYTRQFRQYVEQHSEPLNWDNSEQAKWYIYYDHAWDKIRFDNIDEWQGMEVYGSSIEVMRDAVAFIGEKNVKRYVIGVQDE